MPDPTTTTAAATTLALGVVAVPTLSLFGQSLGLRPDYLLAGFAGSVAAMGLLNTVPSTGDTWRNLVRDSWTRSWTALCSALVAGYATPLVALLNGVLSKDMPPELLGGMAFVTGAGAQRILAGLVANARTAPPGQAQPPQEGGKP